MRNKILFSPLKKSPYYQNAKWVIFTYKKLTLYCRKSLPVISDCENKSFCRLHQTREPGSWRISKLVESQPEIVPIFVTCYLFIDWIVVSIIFRVLRGLTGMEHRRYSVNICWINAWMYFNIPFMVEILSIFYILQKVT